MFIIRIADGGSIPPHPDRIHVHKKVEFFLLAPLLESVTIVGSKF